MAYPMPGGLSPDAYLERRLRPLDGEHFSAAGMLPYKRNSEGQVEVLVAKEKPWNSLTQAYDPLAWNVLGGKRIPRHERTPETTAARCFVDTLCDLSSPPSVDMLHKVIVDSSFMIWYPMGKFALIVLEVTNESFDDLPEKFAAAKPKDGIFEEFKIDAFGMKKWVKNIDALEWVHAERIVGKQFELSDLLLNILKVQSFHDFLNGEFDPSGLPPAPAVKPQKGSQRPWTDHPKGGKKGGGKWNSGKGYGKGKGNASWCKGGPMGAPMMPMGAPMMAPAPAFGKGCPMPFNMGCGQGMPQPMAPGYFNQPYRAGESGAEASRQMYGEQLYMLVQPLSPSPYFAQKITGMLLELPENELMLNLTSPEELRKRVDEALIILKEDGLIE